MRILVHDFAGHPFSVPLSRSLARRGHEVLHAYCGSLQTTPRGALKRQPDDSPSFRVEDLHLSRPLAKYSFFTRWRQENAYGRLLVDAVDRFRPEVVLSGNTPLDAQRPLLRHCHKCGVRFVFWAQDLIGVAAERILKAKIPVIGGLIGRYYAATERSLLRKSDGIVLITEDFSALMHDWGIEDERLYVIENWAPLEEVPVRPQANEWSRRRDLAGKACLLYAGTLGMKHNPELLLQLALRFREEDDVRVVVVSQGLGADWLAEKKREHDLDNLLLLGFQPFEAMPDVLATAAILLAVLEPDAGIFSVPSKVLTYLCAARPVLLAVPPENLAARIVTQNEAGRTVPPTDAAGFVKAAADLLEDDTLRRRLAQNGRRYAEETFDIERITDDFERVFESTVHHPLSRRTTA